MPPGYAVHRPNLRPDASEKGLIAAWDCGDPVSIAGVGPRVMDLVGTFNGVLNGNPFIEHTPLGFGMSFDGVDDFLNVYDGRITDLTQGSMGFWVKARSLVDGMAICSYGGAAAGGAGLFALVVTLVGGNYYFAISQRSDGAVFNSVRGSTVLRVNVWYYVELASDGSAWQLYVNTNTETMTVVGGANNGNWFGDTVVTAPSRTRIGNLRNSGADVNYFAGTIIAGTLSSLIRPESYQRGIYNAAKSACFKTHYEDIAVDPVALGGVVGQYL